MKGLLITGMLLLSLVAGCAQESAVPSESTAGPVQDAASSPNVPTRSIDPTGEGDERVPTATPEFVPTLQPSPTTSETAPPTPAPVSTDGRSGWETLSRAERDTLPQCSDGMLTRPFLDLAKVDSITPLGNISAPWHTIPTEHVYINVSQQPAGVASLRVVAPGDIWVTHISGGPRPDGSRSDYSVHFAICQDVFGYFDHFTEVSPELQAMIDGSGCPSAADHTCPVLVLEPVPAGEPMGSVRTTGNFDLGVWDVRQVRTIANLDRFPGRSRHIQCPLEYFAPTVRDALFALLERYDDNPCGTVTYDVAGTLQGNWFVEGNEWPVEEQAVFFGDDNLDPQRGVASVGGVLGAPGVMQFTRLDSGTTNRRFTQVTPDGQLYCYERDGTGRLESYQSPGNVLTGRLLVQMTAGDQASMELQVGACGPGLSFGSPTTYVR